MFAVSSSLSRAGRTRLSPPPGIPQVGHFAFPRGGSELSCLSERSFEHILPKDYKPCGQCEERQQRCCSRAERLHLWRPNRGVVRFSRPALSTITAFLSSLRVLDAYNSPLQHRIVDVAVLLFLALRPRLRRQWTREKPSAEALSSLSTERRQTWTS